MRPTSASMRLWPVAAMAWFMVVLVLAAPEAAAQAPATHAERPQPCRATEQRAFDFWIGRWEVTGADGKQAGQNHIASIDGGCALIERWQGHGGFTGTSLNRWSADDRRWHQLWVDNQGGVLQLSGAWDGQRMILHGTTPHPERRGEVQQQRITWTPNADGTVRQRWEARDGDDDRWRVVFDGLYRRLP